MAQPPYSAPNPSLQTITDLLRSHNETTSARFQDLQKDLAAKHEENKVRRHEMAGEVDAVIGRVWVVEGQIKDLNSRLFTVVGDGTGQTGMLHKIDDSVTQLSSDLKSLKALGTFLVVAVPIICTIVFGILMLLRK